MSWLERIRKGLLGLGGPVKPVRPERPVPDPYMMPGKVAAKQDQYNRAMTSYGAELSDYQIAMREMQKDAMEHIGTWSEDYPPSSKVGTARDAPDFINMAPTAPVDEQALYGRPDAGPASIVNMRRKRRGIYG